MKEIEINLASLFHGSSSEGGLIDKVRMRRQPTNKNNPDIRKTNLRGRDLGVVTKVEGGKGAGSRTNKNRSSRQVSKSSDRPQVSSVEVTIPKREKRRGGRSDAGKRENLAKQTVKNPPPVRHEIKRPLLPVKPGKKSLRGVDIGGGTSKGSLQKQKKKQRIR